MELKNIHTMIFDFDGTLADTLPLAYHSFQTVFNQFDGRNFSDEDIKNMFGPTEPNIIRNYLESDDKKEAIELYYNQYVDNHESMVEVNSEVNHMLNTLKDRGYKLAIVTGKSTRSLEISLKRLEMEGLFDCLISGDDVTNEKPDPEGVLKVLEDLNNSRDEAVFLGDSDGDIQAGQAAGVHTIGVQWIPNVQTVQFSVHPNAVFKEVTAFLEALS